jgi:glycosyltransferase involved in cell wall biosynthesis
LPSDVFPPGQAGGTAWSAWTLAQALQARGNQVVAIVPVEGQQDSIRNREAGIPTVQWGYRAPRIPFIRNYFRHERLWGKLATVLQAEAAQMEHPLVLHAQHVQTLPAAILAGQHLHAPVVATVRDHWPWDYFATGLHGNQVAYALREEGIARYAGLATDLIGRSGVAGGVLALPALAYIQQHVRRRQQMLARADAVIAVSHYIASRLQGLVAPERLHVLPNMVDMEAVEQTTRHPLQTDIPSPFLLYVGKLERNKGAGLLVDIFRAARMMSNGADETLNSFTLVIAGTGPLQKEVAEGLAALHIPTRFISWVSHDEILRLMERCALLLFPSCWGEPLSRVLLEACAVGAPVIAMPTGGTGDILRDGENGILARTPATFAQHMLRLLAQPAERAKLGTNARQTARQQFAVPAVVAGYEHLYDTLIAQRAEHLL